MHQQQQQQPIGGVAAAALMGLLPLQAPAGVHPLLGAPTAAPASTEQDLSSIHPLSPGEAGSDRDDKEDMFEQCRDTTKLVTQLASVIRGLEADVDSLRRENRSLRKTICASQTQESTRQQGIASVSAAGGGAGSSPVDDTNLVQEQQGKAINDAGTNVAQQTATQQQPAAAAAAQATTTASPASNIQRLTQLPEGGQQHQTSPPPTARLSQPTATSAARSVPQNSAAPAPGSPRSVRNSTSSNAAPNGTIAGLPRTPSPRGKALTISRQNQGSLAAPVAAEAVLSPTSVRTDPSTNIEITSTLIASGQEFLAPSARRVSPEADGGGSPSRRSVADASPCPVAEAVVGIAQVSGLPSPVGQSGAATEVGSKDLLPWLEEFASRREATKAEELLVQHLRAGARPTEACFDVVILAMDREGKAAKAEEWLQHMIQSGMVPSEASFTCIVFAACREKAPQKVEEWMGQMIQARIRPSKETFDAVLRLFSTLSDAIKVEEWLLNAGQSGWTPEQSAFEAAVMLFADMDASKADEWLSRAQQTEYSMPDSCFCAVVQAFTRDRRVDKATDRLSRMIQEGRTPSDITIREVVAALAGEGNIPLAEAWLAHLNGRADASVDGLRHVLFDAAMRTGDLACADQQLALLTEPDADRAERLAALLAEQGDGARARAVLDRYCALGGPPTLEITAALLSVCTSLGDEKGMVAAATALIALEPLSDEHMLLLRHTLGEDRAEALAMEHATVTTGPGDEGEASEADDARQSSAPSQPRDRMSVASSVPSSAAIGSQASRVGKRSSAGSAGPIAGPGAAIAAARRATKSTSGLSARGSTARRTAATSSGTRRVAAGML